MFGQLQQTTYEKNVAKEEIVHDWQFCVWQVTMCPIYSINTFVCCRFDVCEKWGKKNIVCYREINSLLYERNNKPLSHIIRFLTPLQQSTFENIVAKDLEKFLTL